MDYFTWQEPVTAGDKVPNSPDDKPCGDGWIPKEKDCHDGGAHRPEPGKNPYWSGDNSAEKRKERGEPWENNKPKKKDNTPQEEELSPRQERENTKQSLKNYANEHEKALDPSRRTKNFKPEDVKSLEKRLKSSAIQLMGIAMVAKMAALATKRKEYAEDLNDIIIIADESEGAAAVNPSSLQALNASINYAWDRLNQNPIAAKMMSGEKTSWNNKDFSGEGIPYKAAQVRHALDMYNAEKREDDPRDILKWNTLANKPEMMSFDDIPDLAWKGFPEGPKTKEDLKFIEAKMQRFRASFDTWVQTGGKSNGKYLASLLLGKPVDSADKNLESPFLPNPRAAKIILEKSAKVGDEDSNDMLWYEFSKNDQWSPTSYLHDYTKATQKASSELSKLGLDMEDIKKDIRKAVSLERAYKKWEKGEFNLKKEALDKRFQELENRVDKEGFTDELRNMERGYLLAKDILLEEKVNKKKAVSVANHLLRNKIEKNRIALAENLEKANENTRIDEEIFAKIANAFANQEWEDMDPTAEEYQGKTGKKLMQVRKQFRTSGELTLTHQADIEKAFDHFTSILHRNVLSDKRDAKNTKLTEIGWKYELIRRARARDQANTIELDRESPPNTVIHEFAHHLEFRNTRIHQRALDFLETRTRGKKAKGIKGYGKEEQFKEGKFFHKYVGKIYGERMPDHDNPYNPSTEIISMGMESLYDPDKFHDIVTKDPEHLALIIATIRGY